MKRCLRTKQNKGATLIELIVCFALLGIFMSAAAVVIANVTNVFFDVKGQTYGRQVADVLMGKICGEIEGAKVSLDDVYTQPVIFQDPKDFELKNRSGYKIDLYDRTDTHMQIYEEDGDLKIRYFEINPIMDGKEYTDEYRAAHRDEVIWTFDEAVYMGYRIKSLRFVPADQGYAEEVNQNSDLDAAAGRAEDYEKDGGDYPGNVVGVYLTLESPQYGEYFFYKYVKMYNLSDKDAKGYSIPLRVATDYGKN